MHIPENYLSPSTCATMFAVMTPVWYISAKKVKVQIAEKKETIVQLGMGASLAFLIMMFNVPVPGGTTAHAVGSVLLAILLGPWAACLSVTMALILQAFLFGDGGILCLGANAFNMAFVLPFVGYGVFLLCKKIFKKHGNKIGAFAGGYIGIVCAAVMCGIELGIQPIFFKNSHGNPLYCPYPLKISIPAMVGAHLIIGLIEGTITLAVCSYIKKVAPQTIYNSNDYLPENVKTIQNNGTHIWEKSIITIIIIALILTPLGLIASAPAWGEWDSGQIVTQLKKYHLNAVVPDAFKHGQGYHAALDGYTFPGMTHGLEAALGYILCGLTAIVIFLLVAKILSGFVKNKKIIKKV